MQDIRTSRLIIRNFTADDWQDLLELVVDKEASEYAIYDHPFPTGEAEVKGIATWFASGDSFFAVVEPEANKVIGFIALNDEGNKERNLGYCLHSQYQGRGYATEACTAMINYTFANLQVDKLVTGTANENYPSCRLLNRLGFRKTGESVGSIRKAPEGEPIESVGSSFELTKEDWLNR